MLRQLCWHSLDKYWARENCTSKAGVAVLSVPAEHRIVGQARDTPREITNSRNRTKEATREGNVAVRFLHQVAVPERSELQ